MNSNKIAIAIALSVGLVGSAAAFDSEGDIEDRLLASLGTATASVQSVGDSRHAFQSEGDVHDQLFAARTATAADMVAAEPMHYAFEDEGDLVCGPLSFN